ncbi:MAG: hypothetical protein ACXWKG_03130 [Limisphaerales bacterium]
MKKNFLEKLNLRPHERRVVIVVAVIVFVVLNAWFVWPHFRDASNALATINKGRLDWTNHYEKIQKDIRPGGTKAQIDALMKEQGSGANLEGSREIQLQRKVQEKAPQYGITVLSYTDTPTTAYNMGKTNAFFEERSLRISVQCGESNLVNFLYDIGNDSSMIRVRELALKPADQNRYRLNGTILLSANFPKKQPEPARATTTPARPPATAVPKPTMNSSGQKKPPGKL